MTADIGVVETLRAVRLAAPTELQRAREVFSELQIRQVPMTPEIRLRACVVNPETLGSLAAVHLATAETIRVGLGILFSYDEDLVAAALERGIPVRSPACPRRCARAPRFSDNQQRGVPRGMPSPSYFVARSLDSGPWTRSLVGS